MLRPTEKQLKFLNWEMGVFFHFGIRTFYEGHVDWDGEHMPADKFMPESLDCESWIRAAAEGGAKYAILTAKHHDGFANWQSAYTEYSVKNTPWKNGQGDVVREFTDACRKYSLGVGIYYSPAQFGSRRIQGKEYDDYFINQITELLTNYGKIDYLWFDGCGSEGHEYDRDRIVSTIRKLQPDIMIFSMWDPDTRWVGNEDGIADLDISYVTQSETTSINDKESRTLEKEVFLPYECDCKIRRKNWFYSENDGHLLRSPEDLVGLYYYSVGRGGNLLLNIAPDRRGLLPVPDCAALREMRRILDRRFAEPLPYILEKADGGYAVEFSEPVLIDTMVLCEELSQGQLIESFELCELWFDRKTVLVRGGFVGHKRIVEFPSIYGKRFFLRVKGKNDSARLASLNFYKTSGTAR